jgi:hypothetical protein
MCPANDPAAPYPAAPPAFDVLSDVGGPVLSSPRIVPIFFPGYAYRDNLLTFMTELGTTSYWSDTTAEYGVGAITVAEPVDLTEPGPTSITQADLEAWVNAQLTSGAFGSVDPQSIYTVFMPRGSTYVGPDGTSCVATDGYHSETVVGETPVAFAVIAWCDGLYTLRGLDVIAAVSSHEWIEASTDPLVGTAPGWQVQAQAWSAVTVGGEAADLCEGSDGSYLSPPELGLAVQRSWSNTSFRAGHDPCVPIPADEIYFTAMPSTDAMPSVQIAEGASSAVDLELTSDAPIGPWYLSADDYGASKLGLDSKLELSWDCMTGSNGDHRHLRIRVDQAPGPHFEIVRIKSAFEGQEATWPLMVTN